MVEHTVGAKIIEIFAKNAFFEIIIARLTDGTERSSFLQLTCICRWCWGKKNGWI
jgi:hypothetical protein